MSGPERNRARRQKRAGERTRTAAQVYELGCQLTYQGVLFWTHPEGPPLFRFPPKDVALLADLRDCGEKLAVNQSARELTARLIAEVVAATSHAPTAMMLRIVLQEIGHPIEWVTLAELALDVTRPGRPS